MTEHPAQAAQPPPSIPKRFLLTFSGHPQTMLHDLISILEGPSGHISHFTSLNKAVSKDLSTVGWSKSTEMMVLGYKNVLPAGITHPVKTCWYLNRSH